MNTFKSNVGAISTAVQKGGKSITGWALVQQTFNQKMSQAKEVVETLGIKIGQALLPTVTTLLSNVLPVISNVATWVINSGILQTSLTVLGNIIKGVAGFVSGLISGIGRVISFFKQNQVAALALLIPLGMLSAVLVNLAIGAIASFMASLPELIGGFAIWAAGAWAAAAGTIAATWPILAIGAAIAILIGIIILLVTHWKQVVSFLQGAWQAFTSWFGNAIHAVGQFFVNLWNGILAGLHAAWDAITGAVKTALSFLLNTFTAPFRAIGKLFQWLYDHNVYFKRLVDKIRAIVSMVVVWLHAQWDKVTKFITGGWDLLVSTATTIWNNITGAIQKAVNFVVGWVRGQIQSHVNDLRQKWFMLQAIVQQA